MAGAIGLDQSAFDTCLDSGRFRSQVQNETALARELGVQSTPTIIVNGELLEGGTSFEVLQARVESELAGLE